MKEVKIDTANPKKIEEGIIALVRQIFQERWRDGMHTALTLTELKGGVTNMLYKCAGPVKNSEQNFEVLVRIYGHGSEKFIDREHENRVMAFLGTHGLGPKVYALFANGMVYDFIPGRSLTNLELPEFCEKIGRALGRWHQLTETIVNERVLLPQENEINSTPCLQSTMWRTLRKWVAAIPVEPYTFADPEKQERLSREINLRALGAEVSELETALNQPTHYPVVFCHNDLLGPNIIYDDISGRMSFIDYEYANFNHRAFDMANHFCEYAGFELDYTRFPTLETQQRFATAYLTTVQHTTPSPSAVSALLTEIHHFVPVSHFLWGLWGLVQATVSSIDFDYLSYGLTRLRHYYLTKHYIHQSATALSSP